MLQTLPVPPALPYITKTLPAVPQAPGPALNWSNFKQDLYDKLDDNPEGHLVGTNDWITNHAFPDNVKLCLALAGGTRL